MNIAREVNLLDYRDPVFRHHCASAARRSRPSRRGDPLAAAYQVALRRWEHATRRLVAEMSGHGDSPVRILSYWAPGAAGRWQKRFREFDMVGWDGKTPRLACEIKLRESIQGNGIRGGGQLGSALAVARLRWPDLRGLVVNVSMAGLLGLGDHPGTDSASSPLTIPPAGQSAGVILDGWTVGESAVLRGYLSSRDLLDIGGLRAQAIDPTLALGKDCHSGGSMEGLHLAHAG